MTKSKKGVSEMIGYILLISFAVVISGIVYMWMRSYVPQETLECPSDVALMIKNYSCTNSILTVELKNNGRFSVGGVFVNVRNDSTQTIATKDISKYVMSDTGTYLGFGTLKFIGSVDNPLEPSDDLQLKFNLSSSYIGTIYSIDITPIRWQEENKKLKSVNCGDAKVTELIVNCNIP